MTKPRARCTCCGTEPVRKDHKGGGLCNKCHNDYKRRERLNPERRLWDSFLMRVKD